MNETPTRALADELARRVLTAQPFLGSFLGLRDYDALLPDITPEAEQRLLDDLADIDARAAALAPDTAADRVTAYMIRAVCAQVITETRIGAPTYTVTPLPTGAPTELFATAARTDLPDERAAADYLARLRGAARWIDRTSERLRAGRDAGLLPIGSLVEKAIGWADAVLGAATTPVLGEVEPPAEWDGAGAWHDEVSAIVRDEIVPAVARWRELLGELRPVARSDSDAGLWAMPGGDELYRACIRVHTTLDLTAQQLHDTGLAAIAELEARALELGEQLGLAGLEDVIDAVRASGTTSDPQQAILAARAAVARSEARAHAMMPPPLPGPCAVEPQPRTEAEAGMPPNYSPPRADTGRPGTFWFNTVRATAGSGWDLEAVAFHETVPGHHSQLARLQLIDELPLVQQLIVTVHAEGWGLYAERLAGEFGLYSDTRAELGSIYVEMFRAARLVVDTGLHALRWSREQARRFMIAHVALPEQFLADEVDRYLAWPGQALAYLTGQREILRLRGEAQAALGERFDLREFHAVVLDSGSLTMPVLAGVVDEWVRLTSAG